MKKKKKKEIIPPERGIWFASLVEIYSHGPGYQDTLPMLAALLEAMHEQLMNVCTISWEI